MSNVDGINTQTERKSKHRDKKSHKEGHKDRHKDKDRSFKRRDTPNQQTPNVQQPNFNNQQTPFNQQFQPQQPYNGQQFQPQQFQQSRSSPQPQTRASPKPQPQSQAATVQSVRYQSLEDLDDDDKEMFDLLANPKKRKSQMRNDDDEQMNENVGMGAPILNVKKEALNIIDNRKSNSPLVSPKSKSPHSPHSPSIQDFPQISDFRPNTGGGPQWTRSDSPIGNYMSPEDEIKRKQEILEGFDKLARKGVRIHRMFDMSSSLNDMEGEYNRLVRQRELEQSIKFQRRLLLTCVTGVEMFNKKYDPFDVELDGWSEVVYSEIDSYDDIFEELYEKYHTKVKMAPELRLLFALGGSAVMFHISNTMLQTTMPGMQMNPEAMQNIAMRMQNMGKQGGMAPPNMGNMGGNMGGNMMGNMGGNMMGNMGGNMMGGMKLNKGDNGEQPRMKGPSMFEMDGVGLNMNAQNYQQAPPQQQNFQQQNFQQQRQNPQQNQVKTRPSTSQRIGKPSQPGKNRPTDGKSKSKQSNELKEILTGLNLNDDEAHAIATDLEEVIASESDRDNNVRQVQFSKDTNSIRLA